MELLRTIAHELFSVNSIWSIVLRGVIWFAVALVIIVSVDNPNAEKSIKNMKANLGFFFMFVVLGSGLIWGLFGFTVQ